MDTVTIDLSRADADAESVHRRPRVRPVVVAAVGVVVLQLVVRGWVAGSGYFYWDDFILVSRAAEHPVWSAELLRYDHDGHFMPLAFATSWVVTAVAPLEWSVAAASMVLLQLVASVAVLRMLLVLLGVRWAVLVPLVFYAFCPLTIPAFAWWSAALNALPLQGALAWVIADAVLLVRTRRRRYAISGIAVSAVALLFFEKAAIVPFTAFAFAVLVRYVDGRAAPVRTVARRGAALWIGSGLLLACWSIAYLAVVGLPRISGGSTETREFLSGTAALDVAPALFGGPWRWERWPPATPWADPPDWAVVAAWFALAAVVAVTIRARHRVLAVWLVVAAYIVLAQLPIVLARGGPNTAAAELLRSLRYFADSTVVLAAALALVLSAHARRVTRGRSRAAIAVTTVFALSCCWSTYTFVRSWQPNPARAYIANTQAALRDWQQEPLLEQEVPWQVLNPTAYPQNLISRVLSAVAPADAFATSTPRLRMITDTGAIVDAQVWWNRGISPGPDRDCGYRVHGTTPAVLPLDGPLLDHEWTTQLNYLASADGSITVALEHGGWVTVPIRRGLNTVYVRTAGSGRALRIGALTPGLTVCVGVGPVGVASWDN
ncbi:hypothetical protein [Nocardia sp. CC227C]|uniref:hypothetical protein n=1 Tax=Nocardia sp. CC227C TaxID=3044562 RepID=UPI00278C8C67|nr:hypothetical protein [Nocardia sp. CC227C]